MSRIDEKLLKFDVGIEDMFISGESESIHLPKDNTVYPTEEMTIPSLESEMLSKNIEGYLLKELRPDIINKDILIPTRYKGLIHESLEIFDSLSKQDSDGVFSDTKSLFVEENELLSMLSVFANLLIKG
ncbi:type III secretion apparatus assembly protein SctX [Desulfothermus sp.]